MSFQIQPTPVARLNRSQLFGPGSRPEIFEKMAKSEADVVSLDLEDSVAPDDKEKARWNVIEAVNNINWKNKTVSVRINSLDTPFWHRDIIDLLDNCSERLDNLIIPKAGCAADIYAIDALVSSVEKATARSKNVGFEILIESAAGITNVNEIANSSSRIESMALGAADFAASMGMVTTGIGGTQDGYYMHHADGHAEVGEILHRPPVREQGPRQQLHGAEEVVPERRGRAEARRGRPRAERLRARRHVRVIEEVHVARADAVEIERRERAELPNLSRQRRQLRAVTEIELRERTELPNLSRQRRQLRAAIDMERRERTELPNLSR